MLEQPRCCLLPVSYLHSTLGRGFSHRLRDGPRLPIEGVILHPMKAVLEQPQDGVIKTPQFHLNGLTRQFPFQHDLLG